MSFSNRVTLVVDGRKYEGWKLASVTRSLEAAATAFEVEATPRWPGETNTIRIRPGSACQLKIGATKVLTGYVDAVQTAFSATAHTLSVRGRSKTSDLVDSTAEGSRWRNRTVAQIATELAAGYGVEIVNAASDTNPLRRFALEVGETIFEAIDRAARMRGLLVTDDAEGRLVLTRAGATKAFSALRTGVNILDGSGAFDASQVYSSYSCKGQRTGSDSEYGASVSHVVGNATDTDIDRPRYLMVAAETQVSRADAESRAVWEAVTRAARSVQVTYTVAGWRQEDGTIWTPNQLVSVDDRIMWVRGEMLITECEYTIGPQGTRTRIDVGIPAGYQLYNPGTRSSSGLGATRKGIGHWSELDAVRVGAP